MQTHASDSFSSFPIRAFWLVAAVVLLGVVLVQARYASDGEALAAAAIPLSGMQMTGDAQDFELRTLDGGQVRLSALRGEVVFVNFWATWCPPCLEEWPAMERLAQRMSGKGFRMVAVSQDDDWESIREFVDPGASTELLVALDPKGRLAKLYGTEKLPETYVIGRSGRVLARWVNAQPWDSPQMIEWFEKAVSSGL